MSMDDAIECYVNLSKEVFSAKQIGRDGKFKASKLEEVLKRVIKQHTGNADEQMMDKRSDGQVCKTYHTCLILLASRC